MWVGLILMIVGTFLFSNQENIGDIFTLIGATIILGSCIWSRAIRKE